MKWLLLFLVACGGSDAGLLNLGEASAPETSASTDGSMEALAETSTTDGTTSTDARISPGETDTSTTEASLRDTSETPPTDAGSKDSANVDDAYACNLTCALSCSLLAKPMHACCSQNWQCNCTEADASGYCGP